MVVVGAGAIGLEFGYFYASTFGTRVTIVEYLDRIAPNEDEEVSKELEKHYKKMGITVLTAHAVQGVDTKGNDCKVKITPNKGGRPSKLPAM